MALDLGKYSDEHVLTTRDVAEWLGVSVSHVLSLPLEPLPWRTRERRFSAAEVRRVILGEQKRREERELRRGGLRLRKVSGR